jgi:tetratricopeptide (TPR) repeat protein
VLAIDSGFAKAWVGLAKVQRALGELEEASESYQNAFTNGFNMTYTERRQIALEALELNENNMQMRLALSEFYFDRNVFGGAEKQFNFILEHDPNSVVGYLGLGRVALSRLQFTNALGYFTQALEYGPDLNQEIQIYEQMYDAERNLAGPGQPVSEAGQDILVKLSALYLDSGQLSNSWQRLQVLKTRYPDFKPTDVVNIEDQLASIVGDNLPGRPVPDQGHDTIQPGTDHDAYNSVPPTSGPHYTVPAPWGAHSDPIQDEIQLRNLAAGGVIVQYDPDIDDELRQRLANMLRDLRIKLSYCRMILAPYEGLSTPIAVTAWNRILHLEEYDRDQIQVFVDTFIDQGPEFGDVGCSYN